MSHTKSHSPCSQMSSMISSHTCTNPLLALPHPLGVKPRFTSLRRCQCSGSSMSIIMGMGPESGRMPPALENVAVSFDTAQQVVVAGDAPHPAVPVDRSVLTEPGQLGVRIATPELAADEVDIRVRRVLGHEENSLTSDGSSYSVGVSDEDLAAAIAGPPIPLGRRVELPGRGITFVREVTGPPGAPTVVLLHGLIASAGLNWFQVFEPLGRHFRVVAPDLRGHGRGLRSWRRFRLADCADDVAALLDVLGIESAIIVGYSMGGPVAQLLWKQHPHKVDGLVMCATGIRFVPGVRERLIFVTAMAAAAGSTRAGQVLTQLPVDFVRSRVPLAVRARPASFRRWAGAELRRHNPRLVMEAANALGNYDARSWINKVDVPTGVAGHRRRPGHPAHRTAPAPPRHPPRQRAPDQRRAHGVRQAELRPPDPRRLPRGGRSGRGPRGGRGRASGLTARASSSSPPAQDSVRLGPCTPRPS